MSTETPDNPNAQSAETPSEEQVIQLVSPEATESTAMPEDFDCYECAACGYVYEPLKGDNRSEIPPETEFKDLPAKWRCPVCGAPKSRFQNIGRAGKASGFKENLRYGLGVNTLTPGQKNLLIFGSLLLFFIFFLSLYGLQ
ncbi:rubredoxin [Alkalinema pantanalense CENA528]|uniref:rubredoxin n=1 Tax=Alkalinema pantanalense TaxID=1620705 RepID=UPI003D7018D7